MNASTPSAPLLDALMQQLQGAPLQQLAQQLGTSSSQVESAPAELSDMCRVITQIHSKHSYLLTAVEE